MPCVEPLCGTHLFVVSAFPALTEASADVSLSAETEGKSTVEGLNPSPVSCGEYFPSRAAGRAWPAHRVGGTGEGSTALKRIFVLGYSGPSLRPVRGCGSRRGARPSRTSWLVRCTTQRTSGLWAARGGTVFPEGPAVRRPGPRSGSSPPGRRTTRERHSPEG